MAADCRVRACCVCPGAKWTKECSVLASLRAVQVPRLGVAPLCPQMMAARQALGIVCVLGDSLGIQAPAGGLSGRGLFVFHVCQHISAPTASILSAVPGCVLGQKFVFGVNWSLWKVNNSFLAGGVAAQVTPHVWDQCVCCESQRGDSSSQPSFWGLQGQERDSLTMDLSQPSWNTPKVVFVLVGKSNFVTRSSP